ncbi:hypothetical protein BSKO_00261 [Bryopsis sp. KO-2023]|nr:hypothetical protein BSKO_00261 [Bryopsis sp. KO-2023]
MGPGMGESDNPFANPPQMDEGFPADMSDFGRQPQDMQFVGMDIGEVLNHVQSDQDDREICAHPKYERLVRLVFEGRMQGEDEQRRRGLEIQKAEALRQLDLTKRRLPASTPDPEVDNFLDRCCNYIEEFIHEVQMTCVEADNTCNLFKKQIAHILSSGGVRASVQVCQGDEKDLRSNLKRKYGETIRQLNEEFNGRKKKGKLPTDATTALKTWWDGNLVWPYPSEDEKKDLETRTGLSATQINNWFINQRKRHWHKYFKDGRLPQTLNEAREVLKARGVLE